MTKIEVREFNLQGRRAFRSLWDEFGPKDIPRLAKKLSLQEGLSSPKNAFLTLNLPASKLSLAKAIDQCISDAEESFESGISSGTWDWLAARLMGAILDSEDKKMTKSPEAWVVSDSTRRSYRHRIAGPYFTLLAHKENPSEAMAVLCAGASQHPEINEQILANRNLSGSVGLSLATAIYYDPDTEKIRPGIQGDGPGSVRRLSAFLNQIAVTVDFKRMQPEDLLSMLPSEFSRFTRE